MASGGDFNSDLRAHEITGNISSLSCDEFQAMIIVWALMDIETREFFLHSHRPAKE